MRVKDDAKQLALYRAVIEVVNEIGFAAGSVSKIASRAGVSPATLYVYHKNKDDLLVSTYIEIKRGVSEAVLKDFDPSLPVRKILRRTWHRLFEHVRTHRDEFRFAEQFSNSPYKKLVIREEIDQYFQPILEVLQRGQKQKLIKDVPHEIVGIFMFYPVLQLASPDYCQDFTVDAEHIDMAFDMAWDAIRC